MGSHQFWQGCQSLTTRIPKEGGGSHSVPSHGQKTHSTLTQTTSFLEESTFCFYFTIWSVCVVFFMLGGCFPHFNQVGKSIFTSPNLLGDIVHSTWMFLQCSSFFPWLGSVSVKV